MFKYTALLAASIMALSPVYATSASAQGAKQTIAHKNVDLKSLSTGYRSTKVVGATVVNAANEKIGTIDDLIITRSDRVPYGIVSVGGFLGMGEKLVAVPFEDMKITPDNVVYASGTKESLKNAPTFTYAK